MKITRIRLYTVNVPETPWWWSDDFNGQPLHQRAEHGIALVETDQGLTGLTQIERFTPAEVVEAQFSRWLGTDVLGLNLRDAAPPLLARLAPYRERLRLREPSGSSTPPAG